MKLSAALIFMIFTFFCFGQNEGEFESKRNKTKLIVKDNSLKIIAPNLGVLDTTDFKIVRKCNRLNLEYKNYSYSFNRLSDCDKGNVEVIDSDEYLRSGEVYLNDKKQNYSDGFIFFNTEDSILVFDYWIDDQLNFKESFSIDHNHCYELEVFFKQTSTDVSRFSNKSAKIRNKGSIIVLDGERYLLKK